MAVELIVDIKSVNRVMVDLRNLPKEMPKAVMQAVNRTVDHVYTHTSREVRKEYAIKDKDVKSTLKKVKASPGKIEAGVISKGRTLTIYHHFRVSPKKPTPGKRYRVKVVIKKGKMETIDTDPKPFIATANNATQVFKRTGPKRKPLVVLRSLSVPQMISNEQTYSRIQKLAGDMLEKRIEHEINRRLNKIGKGGGGK